MELNNLKNLDMLVGSLFTGKEQNIRYKLLSIFWVEPQEISMCVVEKFNRTKIAPCEKLTMTLRDFLKSVDKLD